MLFHEITFFARDMNEVAFSMENVGVLELTWRSDRDGFGGLAHDVEFHVRVGGQLQLGRGTDRLVPVHRDCQFDGRHRIARSRGQRFALSKGSACVCDGRQSTKSEQCVSHQENLD
ncbi:hypothetical protein ASF58_13315 [Methylobacterium sp. Leaf125]|nr:hypothetical protein ASF58_13315 [Methylobacterium sp. Leaf125]